MATDRCAVDHLPSLPQVLLRILEAIHADQADFRQLAAILSQDPAMSSRLLSVANSSFFNRGHRCDNIERALLVLGTDGVRTLVITAAIKQYFSHFDASHHDFLRRFWRRSLTCATLAQVLAHLTRYPQPDEAYLAGLLVDVGRLALLGTEGGRYGELIAQAADDSSLRQAEREAFDVDHWAVGAALIEGWGLSTSIADAVRDHHEPTDLVQDAHHLTKILHLASLLSSREQVNDPTLHAADLLFGLTESLTRELLQRTGDDVERIAGSLGIDIDTTASHQALSEQLSDLTRLGEIRHGLLGDPAATPPAPGAIERAVYIMLGVEHCMVFTLSEDGDRLQSMEETPIPAFQIPLLAGRSLLTDALLQRELLHSDRHRLAVVDRQIHRLCGNSGLAVLPLYSEGQPVGALALGLSLAELAPLQRRPGLLPTLTRELGAALQRRQQRDPIATARHELRIREAVHEVGNPLSIIGNYLEMLRLKLDDEHEAHQDLQLIREELDRVGSILLRLQDPDVEQEGDGPFDANALLAGIARVFARSIASARQLKLEQQLATQPIQVAMPAGHFKQIITNLLKNAAEALPSGGTIRLESNADITLNGRRHARIVVSDNGPGIDESIKSRLFDPRASTRPGTSGGMGLSIVKRLLDEAGGTILCQSDERGTQFQLLLPAEDD